MQHRAEQSLMAMEPLASIAGGQEPLFAAARFQAQAFKMAIRYQIESLCFLKRRCEQNLKLIDDFSGSDEFNDSFDVISNFMENAALDYTTEARKIASIASRAAADTAKHIRYEVDRR